VLFRSASKAGDEIRKLVKVYTGIETHDLYKAYNK